jgi:hypothetical protein
VPVADHFVAKQLANSTGGTTVVFTQRESPDVSGNFLDPDRHHPQRGRLRAALRLHR